MTDREKLIELIVDVENQLYEAYPYTTDQFRIEQTADYLIANGVTVQQWIPATERLPEEGVTVAVLTKSGGRMLMRYNHRFHRWQCNNSRTTVTHWMPLPEPPKEE